MFPSASENPPGATPLPFKIMGAFNVTPDSFFDGGRFENPDAAVAQARKLAAEGAEIIDIGGESTSVGFRFKDAKDVSAEEETRRVVAPIEQIAAAALGVQISIDTMKLSVAKAAVAAGATYINDVSAFRVDPGMAEFVAENRLDCCLMHMLGDHLTMMNNPQYDDVVDEVKAFLTERLEHAVAAGIPESKIHLDPGIGFGKTTQQDLHLINRLDEIVAIGPPVLFGVSNKKFLGALTGGKPAGERLPGTIAANVLALERGAKIFRVHDVEPVRDALTVAAATLAERWNTTTTTTKTTTTT
jgi:dihydropteroate synthase